ncbi:microtubule-associated serine/threonine-protein kinase 4-like [Ranitomeya imitator]|uniref:microtubule-associated serine/threonine-protein kinase 4-like n=1 Tax=Ranitomeya imitator TaxID=111125 RepID=UPI0037E9A95F
MSSVQRHKDNAASLQDTIRQLDVAHGRYKRLSAKTSALSNRILEARLNAERSKLRRSHTEKKAEAEARAKILQTEAESSKAEASKAEREARFCKFIDEQAQMRNDPSLDVLQSNTAAPATPSSRYESIAHRRKDSRNSVSVRKTNLPSPAVPADKQNTIPSRDKSFNHDLGRSVFRTTKDDNKEAPSMEDKEFVRIMDNEFLMDETNHWGPKFLLEQKGSECFQEDFRIQDPDDDPEVRSKGILTTYAPDIVLPIPDGVLSFTYRLVMKLVSDCLTKYQRGRISSKYLEHLQTNIRTLVQQAEERSQSGDLAFFKQLAQKFLYVLEYMARSRKHLETPDGDSKDGQHRNIGDPNTSEPGLKSDLIEETTEPATADGGISETPEIPESASAVIRSLNPMRKPRKSDFTQIEEISSGSFGAVHLVRHNDTNKVFAMKKQARRKLHKPSDLKRAYLERDITIFSDCPFVVSTFCSFPTKRHLCMVMDFEAGGDCNSFIKLNGPLPLDLASMYIAEMVLAVEYLHSYGVVHRDLKPTNLMITSTGHIKVTDFGISKLGLMRLTSDNYKVRTKDITREFRDNEVDGTYHYLAPEVILKVGYGRPIDWWSIGIILYEFLTRHVPFNGRCKRDIFNSIIKDDITLKIKNSTDNPDAQDFMTKLLRKSPKRRLGTGGANEIKSHPFLRKVDFENLQYMKPLHSPNLSSEEDTRYFHNCFWRPRHMDSDKGDTSEVSDWPESLNYVSSSQRLSKLYAMNTRMMINEDHEPSPDCSLEDSTKHSDVQKETSPTRYDGDDQYFTAENNKSPSPILSVETKNTSVLNLGEEQNPKIVAETTNTSAVKLGEEHNPEIVPETEPNRVETKIASALKLGEDQDPEIVAEKEPSRVETTNTTALTLGEEQNPEIVPETEPSRVETKNISAVKLGEDQDPEIVAETEPSRVETKIASALKLGEDQDPEIVAETEPSRVEKKKNSAINLVEEQNAKIVEEREPRRRSIFRRIISSCRRGLSRAARSIRKRCIFPICR